MLQLASLDEEFNRVPQLRKEYLQTLRDWLKLQPHLPPIDNDVMLVAFLRSCDFSLERTKTTIDNYFTFRTHATDMSIGRNTQSADIQRYVRVCQPVVLEQRDPDGNIVLMQRLLDSDPAKYELEPGCRLVQMIMESVILTSGSAPGIVIVLDQTGVSLGHLARVSLFSVKKLFYYTQECVPVAVKGIHIVKTNHLIEKMLIFVKPFMNRQLYNLIKVYSEDSMKEFYKCVPQEILPQEYGGNGKSMAELYDATMALCSSLNDVFEKADKLKVDESKRRGKPKDISNMFGVEGSFKKLDID